MRQALRRQGLTIVSSGFDTKSIAPPIPLTNLFGIMKLACERTKRAKKANPQISS